MNNQMELDVINALYSEDFTTEFGKEFKTTNSLEIYFWLQKRLGNNIPSRLVLDLIEYLK